MYILCYIGNNYILNKDTNKNNFNNNNEDNNNNKIKHIVLISKLNCG